MYPVVRIIKELLINRKAPKLHPLEAHVSHHRCWPQDIDTYFEMNNGRILTIFDIGRTGLATRVGLLNVLKEKRWGLTMAGVSVRYRRRIRPFKKFRIVSKTAGWDHRFVYLDQSIWIGDECCAQAMYRSAVTSKDGIVPPQQAFEALGYEGPSPELPDWIKNWIDADATRPWPPADSGA
ncbi:acyl-CoA thioesterase [Loktanella sp. S4079]|uniref:acyl-CoA thioesterase n=1 Tax=Loktanella sp. S4079 TaxID=579483 RepID=UPI0005F9EC3C|nr:acyl-CoA thioesterase [Loktanella sp. S4079]KJZ21103.1 thioeseterase [Loktanella sp. S4079]